MRFVDEYRDRDTVLALAAAIGRRSRRPVRLMEVCGGHTMAIHRFGIPSLLPPTVTLLSGPGCPVCVTGRDFIDRAVACARLPGVIVATFGDLIRVPGSSSTLEKTKAAGADVRVVLSSLEALDLARTEPDKKVVFLGIGFETTAPGTAAAILEASKAGVTNFSVLSAHKVMPPALAALIDGKTALDGFLCPGHVSVITGSGIYRFIPEKYGLACVVSGFEPADILRSVLMLVTQIEEGRPSVEIEYSRAVRPEGNLKAQEMMGTVFEPRNERWRGLGVLKRSGLGIRDRYARFNAESVLPPAAAGDTEEEPAGCLCGEILKGSRTPLDCPLFAKQCHPGDPVGACMVSGEGACQAVFRYGKHER